MGKRRSLPKLVAVFVERQPGKTATREQLFDALSRVPATIDQIRSAIATATLQGWIEEVDPPASRPRKIADDQLYRRTFKCLVEALIKPAASSNTGRMPRADQVAASDRRWRQLIGAGRYEDSPASIAQRAAVSRISGPTYGGSVTGSSAAMCAGS
jgi:hypothetical protein